MSKLTAACLVLVLVIPASMWTAFVTNRLWMWFAEPLGAPHLTLARTMGLALILGLHRYMGDTDEIAKKAQEKTGGDQLFTFILKASMLPAFALLFGWIYMQFL